MRTNSNLSSVDTLLIARKLASFCPSSLSIDDFRAYSKAPSPLCIYRKNRINDKEKFIPPSSKVSVIKDSEPVTAVSIKSSRFSSLISSSSKSTKIKNNASIKIDYSLPNIEALSPTKKNHPLLVVSLSTNSLSEIDVDEPVHKNQKDVTTIIQGIKQINSNSSDSDSDSDSDYSDSD